ncbi:MAG: hypothetical protein WCP97_05400 [bacterium]
MSYRMWRVMIMKAVKSTNYKEVREDDLKVKLAKAILSNTHVKVAPADILAVDVMKKIVLFFKRVDNKGRRNRATFYTISLTTGEQTELLNNPLAVQEIDALGILF